jgi:hypothetical protein
VGRATDWASTIGGTFTDFGLLDETSGELSGFKAPPVGRRSGSGCGRRAPRARPGAGPRPGAIGYLVHGTTIAVNTVIQRNGATLRLRLTLHTSEEERPLYERFGFRPTNEMRLEFALDAAPDRSPPGRS